LNFVRVFPFYVGHSRGSWHFQVTVKAHAELNSKTGMSVHLGQMNSVCDRVLQSTKLSAAHILVLLQKKAKQLHVGLKAKSIECVSVDFAECRDWGVLFEAGGVFFIRKDFATSPKGDLFQVTSVFDGDNQLTRLTTHHFKTKITEEIIY